MSAPRGPRRGAGDEGFMLAEALVAMAIGAFLLAALVSLVQLGARAEARTERLVAQSELDARFFDAVARDLGPALRVRWGGAGSAFVFAGTDRALSFAVRDPDAGDLRVVTIADDGGRIVRQVALLPPFARAAADLVPAGAETIRSDGARLQFAYVATGPGSGESTTGDWSDRPLEMPVAVDMTLLDPASGVPRAALRVPLVVDAEPGCAAPRRAPCTYVETGIADMLDAADLPPEAVDAADALGWLRYAR